jgi:hypothetical protein
LGCGAALRCASAQDRINGARFRFSALQDLIQIKSLRWRRRRPAVKSRMNRGARTGLDPTNKISFDLCQEKNTGKEHTSWLTR